MRRGVLGAENSAYGRRSHSAFGRLEVVETGRRRRWHVRKARAQEGHPLEPDRRTLRRTSEPDSVNILTKTMPDLPQISLEAHTGLNSKPAQGAFSCSAAKTSPSPPPDANVGTAFG